jgi:hypothetical protein
MRTESQNPHKAPAPWASIHTIAGDTHASNLNAITPVPSVPTGTPIMVEANTPVYVRQY